MEWSDEKVELIMGRLLQTGVISAAVVVVLGGAWYFAAHGNAPVDFRVFHGEPAELSGVSGVVRGVRQAQDRSLIQFGLLLLIATPIARVVFAVAAFALQKDRTYVAIGLIVLAALLYGLTGY